MEADGFTTACPERSRRVPPEYLHGLEPVLSLPKYLAFLPVALQLRQVNAKHLHLTTHLLVQASQHLWLVGNDDIYQQFT
jgi:hypothetical protein